MSKQSRNIMLFRRQNASPNPKEKLTEAQVNMEYEEICNKSGILRFALREYRWLSYDKLTKVQSLGEGNGGRVTHCKYDGHSIAVKRMKRTDNLYSSKRGFTDLKTVSNCDSPYIIKCLGYFITKDHIDICMEMMMTCFERVMMRYGRGLPEPVLGKIVYGVVNALDYLKDAHELMHRDIKPSNILMDVHGNVKLCDFGISGRLIDSKALTTSMGCYAYLAPERITVDIESTKKYDVRADVWSLGITIVQLARGRFPYSNYDTTFGLLTKIYEEPAPVLTTAEGYSWLLSEFVSVCLQKVPEMRPKYKELKEQEFYRHAAGSNYDMARWYRQSCMDKPTRPLNEGLIKSD